MVEAAALMPVPPPLEPVPDDDALAAAVERLFGFSGFRPGQLEVVRNVLSGRNTVAVMPTGAGKSLCYQLPALLLPGTALIVSPLVALMKDQVDALLARGVPATFVNSSLDETERARRVRDIARGLYKLVYVAPERFRSQSFLDAIAQLQLSLYAVDEAHCISMWGHDFRPDYTRLGQIRFALRPPRTLALTATATPKVRDDIVRVLRLKDPVVSVAGFDRPNLYFEVAKVAGDQDKLAQIARLAKEGSGIVYCATRRDVEKVAAGLDARRVPALAYHAGMEDDARREVQERFMARSDAIVCATNAFGMGVDKPQIRFVVHHSLPKSPEAYYQEVGRAGRDGAPARALLLFNHADVFVQERLLEGSYPSRSLFASLWTKLRYMDTDGLVLDEKQLAGQLGCSPFEVGAAVKHLERAGHLQRMGRSLRRLDDVESGALRVDFEGLAARRAHETAALKKMTGYAYTEQCRRVFLLTWFGDRGLDCAGCDVCHGPREAPMEPEAAAVRIRKRRGAPRATEPEAESEPFDAKIYDALRALRVQLARQDGVPAFHVFHDRTLREFARRLPQSREQFCDVHGVGEVKWEKYGAHVVSAIALARPRGPATAGP